MPKIFPNIAQSKRQERVRKGIEQGKTKFIQKTVKKKTEGKFDKKINILNEKKKIFNEKIKRNVETIKRLNRKFNE